MAHRLNRGKINVNKITDKGKVRDLTEKEKKEKERERKKKKNFTSCTCTIDIYKRV